MKEVYTMHFSERASEQVSNPDRKKLSRCVILCINIILHGRQKKEEPKQQMYQENKGDFSVHALDWER